MASAVTTLGRWRAILGRESSSGMSQNWASKECNHRIRNYITPLLGRSLRGSDRLRTDGHGRSHGLSGK